MTTTEKQMLALLARRQEIDRKTDPGFTENHRWLLEAVELLLRHQLELRRGTAAYAEHQQ